MEQWVLTAVVAPCAWQVKVAHRIYDFVDARIQELDAQLSGFDTELAAERTRLGVEKVRPSLHSFV